MKKEMSKKTPVIIFVGIAVFALLILYGVRNKNGVSTNDSFVLDSTFDNTADEGILSEKITNIQANKEKVALYSNSSAREFEYELKNTYNSREEILQEIEDLVTCCKYFCDKKDSDVVTRAIKTRDGLMSVLNEKLKAYPPDSEENIRTKKKLYDNEMFYRKQFLLEASFRLNDDSKDSKLIQNYEKRKAEYEDAKKIEEKYNKGEITIDEAIEQLGINYTGLPY